MRVHPDLDAAFEALVRRGCTPSPPRAQRVYTDVAFEPGDVLMFGAEPDGLPRRGAGPRPGHRPAPHPDDPRTPVDEPGELRVGRRLRGVAPARVHPDVVGRRPRPPAVQHRRHPGFTSGRAPDGRRPAGRGRGTQGVHGPGVSAATSGGDPLTGGRRASVARQREKMPLVRHALQGVGATFDELDARAEHELSYRAGDERSHPRRHAKRSSRDVDRDAGEILALRSHSPVWIPARISIPSGRTASPIARAARIAFAGPSKTARKPSPRVLIGRPPKFSISRADNLVVPLDQACPALVAELGGSLGRRDDVGEQDRRQGDDLDGRGGAPRSGTLRSRR